MPTIYLKSKDTLPPVTTTLIRSTGDVASLAGATVLFRLRKHGHLTNAVNSAATILDAANGLVTYVWLSSDTISPGLYDAEFVVTYPGEIIRTFPNNGFLTIDISQSLG